MNNKQLDEILWNVTEETFESLAFLLPMPEPDEAMGNCLPAVVSVCFRGPFNGKVIVTLPKITLEKLACNMLGLDDGD